MIMQKLKEATREQHEGLENAVDVMKESLTAGDYGRLLLKFHRFYVPAEEQLANLEWSEAGYDFEKRRKLPALVADLERLGLLEEAKAAPAFRGAPSPDTFAAGFGMLYVLEGATLGGQIISRHLREALGIGPENGGAFFNGYGPMTGPMWKEFGATVEDFAERHGGEAEMIEAAKATFDAFRACFEEASSAAG